EIVVARQRFAEARQTDRVFAALDGLLVARAEALGAEIELRSGLALKAIAAQKSGMAMILVRVTETHDVYAVRANRAGSGGTIRELGEFAARARADGVVHQAAPQQAARIAQALALLARGGVEQDARGLQRLCAENDDAGTDVAGLAGHAVDESY